MAEHAKFTSLISALQIIIAVGIVFVSMRSLVELLVDRSSSKKNLQRIKNAILFGVLAEGIVGFIKLFISYYQ